MGVSPRSSCYLDNRVGDTDLINKGTAYYGYGIWKTKSNFLIVIQTGDEDGGFSDICSSVIAGAVPILKAAILQTNACYFLETK